MKRMQLVVRQGEREEAVTVQRVEPSEMDGGAEEAWVVTVGDRTYHVGAVAAGSAGSALSLRLGAASDAVPAAAPAPIAQHEVSVRPQAAGVYQVTTAAGTFAVEVDDPLTALARQGSAAKGAKRRARVTAYMPGRVVAVLAEEGAEVKAGDGVIVLEAMKMQNEIAAEHDGRIARIFVEAGQAVEGGDPLFELE